MIVVLRGMPGLSANREWETVRKAAGASGEKEIDPLAGHINSLLYKSESQRAMCSGPYFRPPS